MRGKESSPIKVEAETDFYPRRGGYFAVVRAFLPDDQVVVEVFIQNNNRALVPYTIMSMEEFLAQIQKSNVQPQGKKDAVIRGYETIINHLRKSGPWLEIK